MELFHEYYSSQCQFVLDLMALAEKKDEFTDAELRQLADGAHAGDLSWDLPNQMAELGILARTESRSWRLGGFFRPFRAPMPKLERAYLSHLCALPEAELFLPRETLERIRAGCGDADPEFFSFFTRKPWPDGVTVPPETFRPVLQAIAQGRTIRYRYRTRDTERWSPAENVVPFRLEHSVLDGRWWVILYLPEEDRPVKARLENLEDVILGEVHGVPEERIRAAILCQAELEQVVLYIKPEKNALERAFLTFESALDLTAAQREDGSYELRFSLLRFDRMYVIDKLLYLGEYVTVHAPESLREDMRQRLEKCLEAQ